MNRIRLLRERAGMKQSELGKLLNVKDSAISKYETGKIPLTADTLTSLSEIFNVSVDYILGLSDASEDTPIYTPLTDNPSRSLRYWVEKNGIDQKELAKTLGIKEELVKSYLDGSLSPPCQILLRISEICEVSTDCLLGIREKSRRKGDNDAYPFAFNEEIGRRIKRFCEEKEYSDEDLERYLCMSPDEIHFMLEYGFVPHIDTIIKLADLLNTTTDYLLCLIDEQTDKAIKAFRLMNEDSKDIVVGKIKEVLRDQRHEQLYRDPVAAETPLKEVK